MHSGQVSWCKFEVVVDCPKDIQISISSKNTAVIPPVVVTAINLKTILSEKQNVNEIVSASIICCHKAKVYCYKWFVWCADTGIINTHDLPVSWNWHFA